MIEFECYETLPVGSIAYRDATYRIYVKPSDIRSLMEGRYSVANKRDSHPSYESETLATLTVEGVGRFALVRPYAEVRENIAEALNGGV